MHKKKQLRKVKIICKKQRWYAKKLKIMHDACGVIDTACTVHAVSLTPHAKYDTACTIDERFEQQPLKGIPIKNIYVPESSTPPLKNTVYTFKGAT
jgi:hypothetical protein